MRYAGGRPLWQLSLSHHEPDGKPVPVLRWSPTKWRKAEAVRDRIMHGIGTNEPWVVEEMTAPLGMRAISVHYRRPLSLAEVAQMAPTPEVIARPVRA